MKYPSFHISNKLNHKIFKVLSLVTLATTAIVLIALQQQMLGWSLFIAGALFTLLCERTFMKHILLIYCSLLLLGITPISTDISLAHMFVMGIFLALAIAIPYFTSRYIYKDRIIRFQIHNKNVWSKKSISYIIFAVFVVYLAFPFAMRDTMAYLNWTVKPGIWNLLTLFIGTNGLGIWDELFFVNTVLVVLRRHLAFPVANFLQSIIFTSFLYELGFKGYMFMFIFIFALLQGYIFNKTQSLAYVITLHLLIDLVLYFVLLYLHYPSWIPIFIT